MAAERDEVGEDKARSLYERGRELLDIGNAEQAIRVFSESISIRPHFKTLELLGQCYIEQGCYREAIVPLAAATTLNSQAKAPAMLAEALLKLGETEKAAELAVIALSRSPGNKTARRVLEAVAIDRDSSHDSVS